MQSISQASKERKRITPSKCSPDESLPEQRQFGERRAPTLSSKNLKKFLAEQKVFSYQPGQVKRYIFDAQDARRSASEKVLPGKVLSGFSDEVCDPDDSSYSKDVSEEGCMTSSLGSMTDFSSISHISTSKLVYEEGVSNHSQRRALHAVLRLKRQKCLGIVNHYEAKIQGEVRGLFATGTLSLTYTWDAFIRRCYWRFCVFLAFSDNFWVKPAHGFPNFIRFRCDEADRR